MESGSLLFSFFLIFGGAALLSTGALFLRQPLLVAYIAAGALLGPFGLGRVDDAALLADIAEFGILFLLFLLGLDMQPGKLFATLRKAFPITLASSAAFFALGWGTGLLFAFPPGESLVIGFAMIFSSTIIGIKLLPTTALHRRHMGELMVGILLMQDFIAILILAFLDSGGLGQQRALRALLALPPLLGGAWLGARFLLTGLIARFDQFKEYLFLLAIGWCLGVAAAAKAMGLSAEIGAFAAGVALAANPIAPFLTESLKPLRDFFLILFFFSLGARFDFGLLPEVAAPALLLAALTLTAKPALFRHLLRRFSERDRLAWDAGLRLGQISEFSLLIALVALDSGAIGEKASLLIQATAIVTFLASSYIVVMFCPTPIGVSGRLRRD